MDECCTQVLHNLLDESNEELQRNVQLGTLVVDGEPHDIYAGDLVIGRDPSCSIVIDNKSVSSRHACIEATSADQVLIHDVGSANKTRLGKMVLRPNVRYHLTNGADIWFADTNATFYTSDRDCEIIVPETPIHARRTGRRYPSLSVITETPIAETSSSSDDSCIGPSPTDTSSSVLVLRAVTAKKHLNMLDGDEEVFAAVTAGMSTSNERQETTVLLKHANREENEDTNALIDDKTQNVSTLFSGESSAEVSDAICDALPRKVSTRLDDQSSLDNSDLIFDAETQKASTSLNNQSNLDTSNSIYDAVTQKVSTWMNNQANLDDSDIINDIGTKRVSTSLNDQSNLDNSDLIYDAETQKVSTLVSDQSNLNNSDSIYDVKTQKVSMSLNDQSSLDDSELIYDAETQKVSTLVNEQSNLDNSDPVHEAKTQRVSTSLNNQSNLDMSTSIYDVESQILLRSQNEHFNLDNSDSIYDAETQKVSTHLNIQSNLDNSDSISDAKTHKISTREDKHSNMDNSDSVYDAATQKVSTCPETGPSCEKAVVGKQSNDETDSTIESCPDISLPNKNDETRDVHSDEETASLEDNEECDVLSLEEERLSDIEDIHELLTQKVSRVDVNDDDETDDETDDEGDRESPSVLDNSADDYYAPGDNESQRRSTPMDAKNADAELTAADATSAEDSFSPIVSKRSFHLRVEDSGDETDPGGSSETPRESSEGVTVATDSNATNADKSHDDRVSSLHDGDATDHKADGEAPNVSQGNKVSVLPTAAVTRSRTACKASVGSQLLATGDEQNSKDEKDGVSREASEVETQEGSTKGVPTRTGAKAVDSQGEALDAETPVVCARDKMSVDLAMPLNCGDDVFDAETQVLDERAERTAGRVLTVQEDIYEAETQVVNTKKSLNISPPLDPQDKVFDAETQRSNVASVSSLNVQDSGSQDVGAQKQRRRTKRLASLSNTDIDSQGKPNCSSRGNDPETEISEHTGPALDRRNPIGAVAQIMAVHDITIEKKPVPTCPVASDANLANQPRSGKVTQDATFDRLPAKSAENEATTPGTANSSLNLHYTSGDETISDMSKSVASTSAIKSPAPERGVDMEETPSRDHLKNGAETDSGDYTDCSTQPSCANLARYNKSSKNKTSAWSDEDEEDDLKMPSSQSLYSLLRTVNSPGMWPGGSQWDDSPAALEDSASSPLPKVRSRRPSKRLQEVEALFDDGTSGLGKATKGKATKGKATKGRATQGKATEGRATEGDAEMNSALVSGIRRLRQGETYGTTADGGKAETKATSRKRGAKWEQSPVAEECAVNLRTPPVVITVKSEGADSGNESVPPSKRKRGRPSKRPHSPESSTLAKETRKAPAASGSAANSESSVEAEEQKVMESSVADVAGISRMSKKKTAGKASSTMTNPVELSKDQLNSTKQTVNAVNKTTTQSSLRNSTRLTVEDDFVKPSTPSVETSRQHASSPNVNLESDPTWLPLKRERKPNRRFRDSDYLVFVNNLQKSASEVAERSVRGQGKNEETEDEDTPSSCEYVSEDRNGSVVSESRTGNTGAFVPIPRKTKGKSRGRISSSCSNTDEVVDVDVSKTAPSPVQRQRRSTGLAARKQCAGIADESSTIPLPVQTKPPVTPTVSKSESCEIPIKVKRGTTEVKQVQLATSAAADNFTAPQTRSTRHSQISQPLYATSAMETASVPPSAKRTASKKTATVVRDQSTNDVSPQRCVTPSTNRKTASKTTTAVVKEVAEELQLSKASTSKIDLPIEPMTVPSRRGPFRKKVFNVTEEPGNKWTEPVEALPASPNISIKIDLPVDPMSMSSKRKSGKKAATTVTEEPLTATHVEHKINIPVMLSSKRRTPRMSATVTKESVEELLPTKHVPIEIVAPVVTTAVSSKRKLAKTAVAGGTEEHKAELSQTKHAKTKVETPVESVTVLSKRATRKTVASVIDAPMEEVATPKHIVTEIDISSGSVTESPKRKTTRKTALAVAKEPEESLPLTIHVTRRKTHALLATETVTSKSKISKKSSTFPVLEEPEEVLQRPKRSATKMEVDVEPMKIPPLPKRKGVKGKVEPIVQVPKETDEDVESAASTQRKVTKRSAAVSEQREGQTPVKQRRGKQTETEESSSGMEELDDVREKRGRRTKVSKATKNEPGTSVAVSPIQSKKDVELTPRRSARESLQNKELSHPRVLFTSSTHDVNVATAILERLGGSMVATPDKCTVLVTNKVRRTFKFLCCMARGKPIVSPDWLTSSEKRGTFLDPWDFLISDVDAEKKFSFKLATGLRQASESQLLEGYSVYVTPSIQPPPHEMKDIVLSCGGSWLARVPARWPPHSFAVTCIEDRAAWPKLRAVPHVVSAELILLGVLQQRLDFKQHLLK